MNAKFTTSPATPRVPPQRANKLIVHICNDRGGWGKGFVTAISACWPQPEAEYRNWFQEKTGFEQGAVQFVQVEPDLWICQHDRPGGDAGEERRSADSL